MTFGVFLYILLVHWVADFLLQTNEQATKKSTSVKFLTYHVSAYSLVWFNSYYILGGSLTSLDLDVIAKCCIFVGITFVCHWITDFCTSRIGKPFWEKGDYHNGFVVVGFDQILHYVQLFLTYKLLV